MAYIDLWPYKPSVGLTESIEWFTDVVKCRLSEERTQIRTYPRNTMSCGFALTGDAQFSEAKYYAKTTEPDEVRIPWWSVYFNIGVVLSSATALAVDNADEFYTTGDSVFIVEKLTDTYAEKTVSSATSTTLNLTTSVGTTFSDAIVAPLITTITNGFSFTRTGSSLIRASGSFTSVYIKSDANQIFGNYGGTDIPLISLVSPINGSVNESISKVVTANDGSVGYIDVNDDEKYFRHYQTLNFITNGYAEKRAIRRFLHWMKGRLNPFYLPTWVNEVESPEYTLVRSDADRIEVLHNQFNSYSVSIPVVEILESESS